MALGQSISMDGEYATALAVGLYPENIDAAWY
jgi:hypothetical protein